MCFCSGLKSPEVGKSSQKLSLCWHCWSLFVQKTNAWGVLARRSLLVSFFTASGASRPSIHCSLRSRNTVSYFRRNIGTLTVVLPFSAAFWRHLASNSIKKPVGNHCYKKMLNGERKVTANLSLGSILVTKIAPHLIKRMKKWGSEFSGVSEMPKKWQK